MASSRHAFCLLPYELQSDIFATAGWAAERENDLVPLLLVCKASHESVTNILYHTLIINKKTYNAKVEIFRQHQVAFATHCRAFRVGLSSATEKEVDYVWKVLLPGLPRVTHFESFISDWSSFNDHTGSASRSYAIALQAISALPLQHLRLDWHFNNSELSLDQSPSPKKYLSFRSLTHLRIAVQGQTEPFPRLFRWFPSVTHLNLNLPLDDPLEVIKEYCFKVLGLLPHLRLLLLTRSVKTNEFFSTLRLDDPRVVCYDIQSGTDDCFRGILKDDSSSLWRRAEYERDIGRLLEGTQSPLQMSWSGNNRLT
ncbi:hypothetical protein DL96DRAFT_589480 [Flagelloscypha sp. PMI_526]|nr:hypothetical protein DL96DRAFT_589480 [Flagelloscypha sp. PMI_526]